MLILLEIQLQEPQHHLTINAVNSEIAPWSTKACCSKYRDPQSICSKDPDSQPSCIKGPTIS